MTIFNPLKINRLEVVLQRGFVRTKKGSKYDLDTILERYH